MRVGEQRALLPAAVGPLASALILRHFGPGLDALVERYQMGASESTRQAAAQLRVAVAQMRESDRQRRLAQRDLVDATSGNGSAELPFVAEASSSGRVSSSGLTTRQVAEQLRVSPRQVINLIRDMRLSATRRGHAWVITQAAVDEYLESQSRESM